MADVKTETPAVDAAPAAAATNETNPENGSNNNTQEVTSTTASTEPSKRLFRLNTWKKLKNEKACAGHAAPFNRIPNIVDAEKAAERLVGTEEFKNAKKIHVNIARVLNNVKAEVLNANKDLYMPANRNVQALYLHVDVPEDATKEQKIEILRNYRTNRSSIDINNKVEFDMVVIGAVLVSTEGHCIGLGRGIIDLYIALLIEIGSITPKTIIATIVHDSQVVESLPKTLFQKYDVPVDMIVTPTEVIRVAERLPRPEGIFWDMISSRKVKAVYGLEILKEKLEKEGKTVTLKETVESDRPPVNRRRRQSNRRRFQRRFPRQHQRQGSQSEGEQPQEDGNGRIGRRRPRRTSKNYGQERPPMKKFARRNYKRNLSDFSIKVSNFGYGLRVTDLKEELRKRQCPPMYITWLGHYGKCFLHYGKRSGDASSTDEIENVIKSLSDLQITVPAVSHNNNVDNGEGDGVKTKTFKLNVELAVRKPNAASQSNGATEAATADGNDSKNTRIESVDTTAV